MRRCRNMGGVRRWRCATMEVCDDGSVRREDGRWKSVDRRWKIEGGWKMEEQEEEEDTPDRRRKPSLREVSLREEAACSVHL